MLLALLTTKIRGVRRKINDDEIQIAVLQLDKYPQTVLYAHTWVLPFGFCFIKIVLDTSDLHGNWEEVLIRFYIKNYEVLEGDEGEW